MKTEQEKLEQKRKLARERMRRWYKKHPGVQALRLKIWREKHPERWKEVMKKSRLKHKKEIAITAHKYYLKHKKELSVKYKKWYIEKKLRENPNWIPRSERPSHSWKTIRKKVLKRDHNTCQGCGCKYKLEVHHIDGSGSNKSIDKTNNKMSNLITLCHTCHMEVEIERVGSFSDGKWQRDKERDMEIYVRSEMESQSQIARDIGLSRQRVSMIIHRINKEFKLI